MPRLARLAAFGLALIAAAGARADAPLDPSFDAIVSGTTEQNHAQARARMERWVDAHPGDPSAARGLLWMAQLARTDGEGDGARPLLMRVIHEGPGTDWALHAQKQLADLDLDSRHFAAAIASYEQLAKQPAPFWQYVGKSAAADARSRRLRFYGLLAALALLISVAATRVMQIGPRALWPLPNELAYPLPVLMVISLASFSQPPAEKLAVLTLSLGAIALLWINGAWLTKYPPRGLSRIPQALLGFTQAVALFYCAIIASGLWEKLVDTWQMGAD